MCRVATGASGCHDQSLEKVFTVDAFRVILRDVMLIARIKDRRPLAFPMATAAKYRHVGRIGGRFKVRMGQNPMSAVAILARRSIGTALLK